MTGPALRLTVYLVVLCAVVASMIPAVRFNQVVSEIPFDVLVRVLQILAVVVLTHFPSILPVRNQVKYMGGAAKWFGRYPESPAPFLVWMAWVVGGAKTGQTGMMVLAGAVVALCLGVAYGAIRAVDMIAVRANTQVIANPALNLAPLRTLSARFIYFLRVLLVLGSGAAVVGSVALGSSAQAVLLLVISCAIGAATIGFFGVVQARAIARSGAHDAARQVRVAQQDHPAAVAVHYSQPAQSEHRTPKELSKTLREEGLLTALISRETSVHKTFKPVDADYLWPAPTITHLDAYALETLRAIFYTNDAIKNGHFTRFNQFIHVLVAESGSLGRAVALPRGLAIYDAVVAPDFLTAQRWRAVASPEIACRIMTVGKLNVNATLLPAIRRCSEDAVISVHVRSEDLEEATFGALMDGLLAVFADVVVLPEVSLMLSYTPDRPSRFLDLLVAEFTRQAAVINGTDPEVPKRIFLREGRAEAFHNAADVLIATGEANVSEMLETQKLVFWLGGGTPPAGVLVIGQDGPAFGTQLEEKIKTAVTHLSQHYDCYSDLVADIEAQRGQWT